MKARLIVAVAGLAILAVALPLAAHHSFSAEYGGAAVALTGKVTAFEWVNPHSWLSVEVTNADGTKTVWRGETPPVNALYRNGWTKPMTEEMVMKAEVVTMRGTPAKDGSHHIFATGVTRGDGKTVLGLSGAPPTD